MRMEQSLKSGIDQMRVIFDLCDQDNDGLICAQDFREIGREHFEKPDKVDALVQVMDPHETGKISFLMFCRGIETFLLENQHGASSEEESSMASLLTESSSELKEYESRFSGDYVYPLRRQSASSLSNGYITPNSTSVSVTEMSAAGVELVVDDYDATDGSYPPSMHAHSTPASNSSSMAASRGSPTQSTARHLMRRHQLALALPDEASSLSSTPAEGDEEVVGRLNDQLCELSSRLEELEEDQKGSEGYRARLKRENDGLKRRLEECEDYLRASEEATTKAMSESQEQSRASINKMRIESEGQMLDLKAQLQLANEKITKTENSVLNLKAQLYLTQEEKLMMEKEAVELEERKNSSQDALHKTREVLKLEGEKWEVERGALNQAIHDRDTHIEQLQQDCQELHSEQKRMTITTSDMDREINKLKQICGQLERQNHDLQSRFFQEGKKLVAATSSPPSLAMEIDSVSKKEVAKALRESEETNARLNTYIDGLLTTIMEKHPELLEKSC